jgi:hypothetical protein
MALRMRDCPDKPNAVEQTEERSSALRRSPIDCSIQTRRHAGSPFLSSVLFERRPESLQDWRYDFRRLGHPAVVEVVETGGLRLQPLGPL